MGDADSNLLPCFNTVEKHKGKPEQTKAATADSVSFFETNTTLQF